MLRYNNSKKKKNKTFLPWIEKYRPSTLDDIVSHDHVINALRKFMQNKTLPHLLFYGPSGTGKTSSIMACARELYGADYNIMTMELNASDDRGIEVVRNKIKQFVMSDGVFNTRDKNSNKLFKLVILDETDAMTDDAQAILRQIMERYTYNARFCLICNYVRKINPALRSRCTSFRFPSLSSDKIIIKVNQIIKLENIDITQEAINIIVKWSNGDMRKILNALQSTYMAYSFIDEKTVNKCLGYPDKETITTILNNIITLPYGNAYNTVNSIIKKEGLSLTDIITEIHEIILNHILGININDFFVNNTELELAKLLYKLKDVEFNQHTLTSSTIQLGAFNAVIKSLQ